MINKITKEDILLIPKLRQEGNKNQEIASKLNIKLRTLQYWIKRLKDSGHDMKSRTIRGRKKIEL